MESTMKPQVRMFLGLSLAAILVCDGPAAAQRSNGATAYEVWIVDQSDTPGLNHGGRLYIFAGADLRGTSPASAKPAAVVDLGKETAALCQERTGANPVRPHM